MLEKSVKILFGLPAWRFVLKLDTSRDKVGIGRRNAQLIAREVLHDWQARFRHAHGATCHTKIQENFSIVFIPYTYSCLG
ncbi:MAG TPA: hypothetical protein VKK79_09270 [Candidatus Lokiarchaeia archaeon]|nr:hypothetical protein [Candidatus Lokiarchaeia archaeon]